MRVLVAEDDGDQRMLICEMLECDGHQILQACDGPETLALLSDSLDDPEKKIDVMVLDVHMPGCSGLGVLVAMGKHSSMPNVVVITALVDPSIELVARRHGARSVLRKPFAADDLRTLVADAE